MRKLHRRSACITISSSMPSSFISAGTVAELARASCGAFYHRGVHRSTIWVIVEPRLVDVCHRHNDGSKLEKMKKYTLQRFLSAFLLLGALLGPSESFSLTETRRNTKCNRQSTTLTHRPRPNEDDDWTNMDNRNLWNRRKLIQQTTTMIASSLLLPQLPAAAAAAASTTSTSSSLVVPSPPSSPSTSWPLGKVAFSLLPLAGTSTRRATVEETIIPDTMWTHDQIQGIVNVNVPVRMTTIRLKDGGLWVHNPVAPTPQLLEMMKRLEDKYGPVRHIVLGSVALEHKATFGPFCQKFPQATVWVQPGQWAFPLDLPIDALGVTQKGKQFRELPIPGRSATNSVFRASEKYGPPEWTDEIEYEVLGPLKFESVGAFSETAFFHKATKTLLVTDTVVSVNKNPPPIIEEDPRALLFHARDNITEVVADTPENRQRGWRRMVQFGLVFFPSQITVVPAGEALKEASQIDPSMRNLGDGAVPLNLYPWAWDGNSDERNFEAISENGALFCPPILTKLILDREPQTTLEWVDRVTKRFSDMKRIVPCHLNNNIPATAKEFSLAFEPLRSSPTNLRPQRPLAEDLALLQKASDLLTDLNIVGPSLVCDGEAARKVGRFAKSR
jgi:Domain of unknown function (DUF4336)